MQVPIFNGHNYVYQMSQMRDFLCSLGDYIQYLIENEWNHPTKTLANRMFIPKHMIEWTKEMSIESEWNTKELCCYYQRCYSR